MECGTASNLNVSTPIPLDGGLNQYIRINTHQSPLELVNAEPVVYYWLSQRTIIHYRADHYRANRCVPKNLNTFDFLLLAFLFLIQNKLLFSLVCLHWHITVFVG